MIVPQVIRRLLYLKKLDGFPVIREAENNDDEEVSSTMDIEEIDRLARYLCSLGVKVRNMKRYFNIYGT